MSSEVPQGIDRASAEVQGMFPGLWWNKDRSYERSKRVSELKNKIPESDAVAIVDSDADGRACEVVIREKFDSPTVIVANGNRFGIYLTHALNIVAEYADRDSHVYIADLSPDSTFSSFLAPLARIDAEITVYDHHDWKWNAVTSVESVVDSVVLDDDYCAAQILQKNLYPEADDQLVEFLSVTADHDLWIKEDMRSNHLSTLSFQLSRDEYVEYAREFGADMVEKSSKLSYIYEKSERIAEKKSELAVKNADWIETNNNTVALTYFDCHQSRTGEYLIDEGADLAVIVQPTLGVSFRSTQEFGRCAEIARSLGGGGHEDSAGANLYKHLDVEMDARPHRLTVDEIGETKDQVSKNDMSIHEYIWRTEGKDALDFIKSHIRCELDSDKT